VPLPGNSPSLSVYWVLSIAAGCREPDLAYDFIAHAVSPEMDRITAEAGAVACRLSTWRDAGIRRAFPPYAAMEEAHRGARHLPQTARYPIVNDALGDAIDAMYRGRLTVEEALRQAAERANGGLRR
jgi:multiple sugar transport system substrate-binding protein